MKSFALVILGLSFAILSYGQTPYYMLFNYNCMEQLEYTQPYNATKIWAYVLRTGPNEHYVFTAGTTGIASNALPEGTVNCSSIRLSNELFEDINKQRRTVYMVQQTPQGYNLMPIVQALHVYRNSSFYYFRSASYTFSFDTLNRTLDRNLAAPGSLSNVYFTGVKRVDCKNQYAFRREPVKPGAEHTDMEIIPTLGVVSQQTGNTSTTAQKNLTTLVRINNAPLETWLSFGCQEQQPVSTIPQGTAPLQYGFNQPYSSVEPDKESTMINQKNQAAAAGGIPLPECPEQPGYGYHVVRKGETLNAISRAYNVPVGTLMNWNNLRDPNKINLCQKIFVTSPADRAAHRQSDSPANFSNNTPKKSAGPEVEIQRKYWDQTYYTQQPPADNPVGYNYPESTPAVKGVLNPQYYHYVKPGETVAGIARLYGFTEVRLRAMNNMPASGNVVIYPNQPLLINDCPPASSPSETGSGGKAELLAPQNYIQPNPDRPTEYSNINPPPASDNNQFYEMRVDEQLANPDRTPGGGTKGADKQSQPDFIREHRVQAGETLTSIAVKYNVSAAEIAITNNLETNETLIPGKVLAIPVKVK